MPDTAATDAAFEARYGRRALFERHARNRVHQVYLRQVPTVLGAALLAALVSPWAAALAIALALLGEGAELAALTHATRRLGAGVPLDRLMPLTTAAAGFQAVTISACVHILLAGTAEPQVQMLGLCFLMGAAMNAGFVLTHDPPGAVAKLAVYAVCGLAQLAQDLWEHAGLARHQAFVVIQMALLAFMAYAFVAFAHRAWKRRLAKERDLMRGAARLEALNADLLQAQKEARELSQVARQANDSIILTDPQGRNKWVNAAFTRLTGYAFEEAVGRGPSDLLDGPESCQDTARRVIAARAAGRPMRAEVLNYRKDGSMVWMEINLVPVHGPDGAVEGFLSIERDMTEARAQAAELAEAKAQAEKAARAKSIFLATMSHEIRTPLNAIIGMSELLAEGTLDRNSQEYVQTIRSSSEALLKIINDILDLSRLDADKLSLESAPFSLGACLRDAAALLRPGAREKGLYLDVTHETSLPDRVRADEGRLRQVLVNLLWNRTWAAGS